MTEFLQIDGGQIAYDVTGEGPLVVLSHGIGDRRESFRHLAPLLIKAGYRVATVDLRGHGESSTGWASYMHADTAGDLITLIRQLGGPAILVGQSFSGGAATIAAAQAPDLISAVVEIDPFTRNPEFKLGNVNLGFVKGTTLLMAAMVTKSVSVWLAYLKHAAYPTAKPADFTAYLDDLRVKMSEPGRFTATVKMGMADKKFAGENLAKVTQPVLVVMGTKDPDFPSPKAEAEGIAAALPDGRVQMIEGAGHYPHAEMPGAVATSIINFLKERTGA